MKQLLTILIASFALTAFAAETAATAEPVKEGKMMLAKKKDHSKDKKVDATKSPKKAETSKK
jgi:Ni/Co efflux regulator RcnB